MLSKTPLPIACSLRGRVMQEPLPPEVAVLDPDAAPLYWQEPGMLLNLFGEMAERNLFLVQHLQVRLAHNAACAFRVAMPGCAQDECHDPCTPYTLYPTCNPNASWPQSVSAIKICKRRCEGPHVNIGVDLLLGRSSTMLFRCAWPKDLCAEHRGLLSHRAQRSRSRLCAASCAQRAPPWTPTPLHCKVRSHSCAPRSAMRSAGRRNRCGG